MKVSQETKEEYDEFKIKIYKNTFKKSYKLQSQDNRFSREQINTFYNMCSDDLKTLKEYMINTLYNHAIYMVTTDSEGYEDYFTMILVSYAHYYKLHTKDNRLTLEEVIGVLYKEIKELVDINIIKDNSARDETDEWFGKPTMYRQVYVDDNVCIYYLEGINGLYVEERTEKLDNRRYYLYPVVNEDGKTYIKEVTGFLPFELIGKLTKTEEIEIGGRKYIKYQPINCPPEGWAGVPFTSDSFINLTGDSSLPKEEAFRRTCEIINSCPELTQLIKVENIVYKKED